MGGLHGSARREDSETARTLVYDSAATAGPPVLGGDSEAGMGGGGVRRSAKASAAPSATHAAPTRNASSIAASQCSREGVAAGLQRASVVGRDRSQHREAERAGHLQRDVDDAGGEACVLARHVRHGDREQRDERQAGAQAENEQGEEHQGEVGRVLAEPRQQQQPGRRQDEPGSRTRRGPKRAMRRAVMPAESAPTVSDSGRKATPVRSAL